MSFSPPNQSKFFSHTLELPITISSYRDLYCERILGDQSVVITKVLSLYFEDADLRVRGVSSSSERVFVLTGTREGLESPKEF